MRERSLSDGADAGAHQADRVEIGLFARALFGAFAGLIALVEQLDLLQFVESLREKTAGFIELNAQLLGRTGEIFPALDRSLGVGRIREMRGIVDTGAFLLGL